MEISHQEGKAEGLDQYQLRDFLAIQCHVALVAVVYSFLRAAQYDPRLRELLQRQIKVMFEQHPATWPQASQAQALWCLALLIGAGLAKEQSLPQFMAPCSALSAIPDLFRW